MLKKKVLIISSVIFLMSLSMVFAQGITIPEGTGLSEDSFAQVLDRVLNWGLMIFVILATMAFVITGLQFIFSFGGASGTQESAKKNFTYTIIAIFIVGGALIILNTIVGLLGNAPAGQTNTNDYQAGEFSGTPTNGASTNEIPPYEPGPYSGNTSAGNNNTNDHQANEFEGSIY